MASFSIDQQRYNAQFGGQLFYEIKGGKIAGMLKDVAYQIRTPDFWNSMDMIGGKTSYKLGGSFFDGKGQPGQVNAREPRLRADPLQQSTSSTRGGNHEHLPETPARRAQRAPGDDVTLARRGAGALGARSSSCRRLTRST